MLLVPFTSDYDQRFRTTLNGEKYTVDCRWNERGQAWSFDLTRDSDGEVLLAGAPLLIGQDVLAPYALGIGGLLVTDLGKKDTDAGPEDLGTRVIVVYLSPDELAAIKIALGPAGSSIVASGAIPPIVPAGGGATAGAGTGTSGGITTIVNVTNVTNTFTSEGGQSFGSSSELDDDSGDEIVVGVYAVVTGLNPNPTIIVAAGIWARGNGTLRLYTGGVHEAIESVGTPSGSLRGTVSVSGEAGYEITSAAFSNPGDVMLVKVTMQSDAPATSIGAPIIQGAMS